MTITITDNRTHIKQMKDEYKIVEVAKKDIIDFGVDMTNGGKRIVFKEKNDKSTEMHFCDIDQFNDAISALIEITDRMGV